MRGDEEVVERLDRAEWVGLSPVVVGELRAGFLLGNRQPQNEADLQRFLANPVVTLDGHFKDLPGVSVEFLES